MIYGRPTFGRAQLLCQRMVRYVVTSSNRLALTLNKALLSLQFQRMLIFGRPNLGQA